MLRLRTDRGRAKEFPCVLVLLTASLSLMGPGTLAADGVPAIPVTVGSAQQVVRPELVNASGAIFASDDVSVSARVAGLSLVRLLAHVGDRVQKGQLLAQFDDAPVRTEVAQAEAILAQAKASAQEAEANRDRALELEDAMSKQDILQSTTRFEIAQSQVTHAKAVLAAEQLRLAYTRVIAPEGGAISSRTAMLGAVPAMGSELFRIIAKNHLEWRAELSDAQLLRIKPGQSAHVTLPNGEMVDGRVRESSPALNVSSRLGLVYVDLRPSESVRVNMYVKGTLALSQRPVLLVPSESLVTRDGRTYAVTLQDNQAHFVNVTVGERSPESAEVLTGLNVGQKLIVKGAGFLSEGARVTPVTQTAAIR
jgi:RND family efflux transporter MFP subunit